MHRLLELGCELGQGYLFSPAVPIEQALGQVGGVPVRAVAAAYSALCGVWREGAAGSAELVVEVDAGGEAEQSAADAGS